MNFISFWFLLHAQFEILTCCERDLKMPCNLNVGIMSQLVNYYICESLAPLYKPLMIRVYKTIRGNTAQYSSWASITHYERLLFHQRTFSGNDLAIKSDSGHCYYWSCSVWRKIKKPRLTNSKFIFFLKKELIFEKQFHPRDTSPLKCL